MLYIFLSTVLVFAKAQPEECNLSLACSTDGDVCQYNMDATANTATGQCCTPTMGACTDENAPVCCEGNVEYNTQCSADLECASHCTDGECPQICSESENKQCSVDGAICRYETTEDISGTCCIIPTNGMCTFQYDAKCCDGTTYGNQCEADLACANYCIDGECCGPTEDKKCSTDGDQCRFENETDEYGICCTPDVNGMCTYEYDPKCCEGTTFGNQCAADLACANYCIDGACPTETTTTQAGGTTTQADGTTTQADGTTTQADDESCEISCNEGINDVCNPFVRDTTEDDVCQFCFKHQQRCEKMIDQGKYQWKGTAFEEQCFIDYCSQRNTKINGCINIGIDLTVDLETECSCGIFICNEFQNNNACSFGIWIGITFGVAMFSWI